MDLQKAFEIFKSIPFPDDSPANEELSNIFSEIVLYDMFIAGNVDAILSGNKNIAIENDNILEKKVNDFLKKENLVEEDRQTALRLKKYLNEISLLITVAKKHLNN